MIKHISIFENNLHRYLPLFEKDMRRVIIDKLHIPEDVANALHAMSDKYSINLANYLNGLAMAGSTPDMGITRKNVIAGKYDALPESEKTKWKNHVSNIYSEIRQGLQYIVDWLSRRINTPNPDEPRDLDLKKLTYEDAMDYATKWHESLKAGTMVRGANVIADEKKRSLLRFPDGWYWLDLKTNNSEEEHKLMGHCGRDSSAQTLLSLRDDKGIPHVTVSYDYGGRKKGELVGGYYRQAKGREEGVEGGEINTKPDPKFHDKIVALFDKLEIAGQRARQYKPESDFKVTDLDKTKYADFLERYGARVKEKAKDKTFEERLVEEGLDKGDAEIFANVLENEITIDENTDIEVITGGRIRVDGDEYVLENNSEFMNSVREHVYEGYTQDFPNYLATQFIEYVDNNKEPEEQREILRTLFASEANEDPRDKQYEDALVELVINNEFLPKRALVKSFVSGKLATPFNLSNMLVNYFMNNGIDKLDKLYDREFPRFFLRDMEKKNLWDDHDTSEVVDEVLNKMSDDDMIQQSPYQDNYMGEHNGTVVLRSY